MNYSRAVYVSLTDKPERVMKRCKLPAVRKEMFGHLQPTIWIWLNHACRALRIGRSESMDVAQESIQ